MQQCEKSKGNNAKRARQQHEKSRGNNTRKTERTKTMLEE
jgi:hypothetical protein